MTEPFDAEAARAQRSAEIEAVMLASRALVGICARSLAGVDDTMPLPQFRVLVLLASRGMLNLAAVARELGVHASNVTRAVDPLVRDGLVVRHADSGDRRAARLELTADGRAVVEEVHEKRRDAIADVLERMEPLHRAALGMALMAFAEVAGEVQDADLWRLGWVSTTAVTRPASAAGGARSAAEHRPVSRAGLRGQHRDREHRIREERGGDC